MTAVTICTPQEAKGEYRDMLVRLMTRQFFAETATAEVFGRSIGCAPTLREKFLAAEFAREEADHSERLCRLMQDLGVDPENVHRARPPASCRCSPGQAACARGADSSTFSIRPRRRL